MEHIPEPTDLDLERLGHLKEAFLITKILSMALLCRARITGGITAECGVGYALSYPKEDRRYKHGKMIQKYFEGYARLVMWPNPSKKILTAAEHLGYTWGEPEELTIGRDWTQETVMPLLFRMYANAKWASTQLSVLVSLDGIVEGKGDAG